MNTRQRWLALFAALAVLTPMFAVADDDDEGEEEHHRRKSREAPAVTLDPLYVSECGSCHLAYPPRFLPARSWNALLAGLGDHFGQNAELDPKTQQQLKDYLTKNAGRDPGGAVPLRITTLRWWIHEHDEIPAATYRRKAVMSPANCGACHTGASTGDFDEHGVRIPRDAPPAR
ncbi:MAG: diheme cytochrome c [Myxococcaceae bacterium]